jgi:hypothetical protein
MTETTAERLLRVFHGDPVDPLKHEVASFNETIKVGREAATMKVSVPSGDIDRDDPLGRQIASFNARIAIGRVAAAGKKAA